MDIYAKQLINMIRAHTHDNDVETIRRWKEITSIDIVVALKEMRQRDLEWFQEWIEGSGPCVECERIIPRLEMYVFEDRQMRKVEYRLQISEIWAKASGACYDCQKAYIDNHTCSCVDCGSPFFSTLRNQVRCEDCQDKHKRIVPHNTRARKLGLVASLKHTEWDETLNHFSRHCVYCDGDYEVIEHFTPLTRGGETSARNCIPSCNRCNVSKKDLDGRGDKEELATRLSISIDRLQEIELYLNTR